MAMLRLRDGRDLEVKETVEEVVGLVKGGEPVIELHEVRRVVLRKFMTPVDTKAEFEEQEIAHHIMVASIMDIQMTAKEAELLPVHGEEHKMYVTSGPFEHNYDQHVFGQIVPDHECAQGTLVVTEPSMKRGQKDVEEVEM